MVLIKQKFFTKELFFLLLFLTSSAYAQTLITGPDIQSVTANVPLVTDFGGSTAPSALIDENVAGSTNTWLQFEESEFINNPTFKLWGQSKNSIILRTLH